MKHNRILIFVVISAMLCLAVAIPGQQRLSRPNGFFDYPFIEQEEGADFSIVSDLWLRYVPWRFGRIDRKIFFLIIEPQQRFKSKLSWHAWIGPCDDMKDNGPVGPPERLPDGTYKFTAGKQVFTFPAVKGRPATYGSRSIWKDNIEFGPATAVEPITPDERRKQGPCP